MKFNNKVLGLIFLALLLLYLFKKFVSKPEVRSFKAYLVQVDTSAVDKIIINPKGNTQEVTLNKTGGIWKASAAGKEYIAEKSIVNSLLTSMLEIKPKRLISKDAAKWTEYELDDQSGTKLQVYSKGQLQESFVVGRFNFDQQARTATTYMRSSEEEDIYSVDGFLAMTFNKDIDAFRNKQLFQGVDTESISKIRLKEATQTTEINKGIDSKWVHSDGRRIDSTQISSYLNALKNMIGSEFSPLESIEDKASSTVLTFETDKQLTIRIDAVGNSAKEGTFLLESSLNPGSVFISDSTGLFKRLVGSYKEMM